MIDIICNILLYDCSVSIARSRGYRKYIILCDIFLKWETTAIRNILLYMWFISIAKGHGLRSVPLELVWYSFNDTCRSKSSKYYDISPESSRLHTTFFLNYNINYYDFCVFNIFRLHSFFWPKLNKRTDNIVIND